MIKFDCTCGAHFEFASRELAEKGCCPKCGARAAEVLGLTSPPKPQATVTAPASPPPPPAAQIPAGPKVVMPPRKEAISPPLKAPATATAPAGASKLRIRKPGESPAHAIQSLPGLERPEPSASPAPGNGQDDVPVLQPVEDDAPPPAATRPPTPPVAPKPISERTKLSVRKEQPAGAPPAAAAAGAAPGPQAVKPNCARHPDKQASNNCMNCGKPICIECIHENGYYCSTTCKEAVKAKQPTVSRDAKQVGAIDEKVGKTMESLGAILGKLKKPALFLLIAVIGYFVYTHFWGPKGQVTARLDVYSEMNRFNARYIEPDTVVVQENDNVFMAKLSTGEKLWTVNLAPFEEKVVIPKRPRRSGASEDDDGEVNTSKLRDHLNLAEVHGDFIIARSGRQLLVLDKQGQVKWKFFQNEISLGSLGVVENGILCALNTAYYATPRVNPRLVMFSLADGSQKWAQEIASGYGARQIIHEGRLVQLLSLGAAQGSVRSTAGTKRSSTSSSSGAGAAALLGGSDDDLEDDEDESPVAAGNYVLRVQSLTDGSVLSEKQLSLPGGGTLKEVGRYLALVSGNQLQVFQDKAEPLWTATLAGPPDSFAGGGDVIAVAASDGVSAYDARSGQKTWTRAGLTVERLAVGPDGAVYATVSVPKDAAQQGEAKDYRLAPVTTAGFGFPGEDILCFLRLDVKDGTTDWGVKNIGRSVMFGDRHVYVLDEVTRVQLLASQGPFVGHHAIRCLSPRNGKDVWKYLKQGDVYHHELVGRKIFLVSAEDPPAGRFNPSCNYNIQIVESK